MGLYVLVQWLVDCCSSLLFLPSSLPFTHKLTLQIGYVYSSLIWIINICCHVCIIGPTERGMGQLAHILPDYMLVFAVPVLAHDPDFTSNEDMEQLTRVRQCLWFILEPLMTKNEFYCFGFYKNLIERMKNHKDALKGEDDSMNYVSKNNFLLHIFF